MKLNLTKKFNLPTYTKGKTFAEASKAINNKFEGRNDKVSLDTKKELLSRLAQAQEYVKSMQEPTEQPTEEFAEGGGMSAGGYAQMGQMGINLGSQLGLIDDKTSNVLGGAAQGAAMGSMLGPIGAIGGGLAGLAGGLLENKSQKDQEQEDSRNNALAQNAQYSNSFKKGGNIYNTGGPMGCGGPGEPPCEPMDYPDNSLEGKITWGNDVPRTTKKVAPKIEVKPLPKNMSSIFGLDPMAQKELEIGAGFATKIPQLNVETATAGKPDQTKFQKQMGNVKDFAKNNYADILRYAPVGVNALQLKNLKKPEFESLDRLDNRYEKDMADENSLRNNVQQQTDNTRRALLAASAGSLGAARANILGSQINSTNALSQALIQSDQINRGENTREQQFNQRTDQSNIQQSNMEREINAQNEGVYETNKSRLIGQLGNDVGNIGKEEKFKQMIKDMGVCYDTRGKYICGTEERIPEGMDTNVTNENANGGQIDHNTVFTTYLEKVLNKNK